MTHESRSKLPSDLKTYSMTLWCDSTWTHSRDLVGSWFIAHWLSDALLIGLPGTACSGLNLSLFNYQAIHEPPYYATSQSLDVKSDTARESRNYNDGSPRKR